MISQRRLATWTGISLGMICALLISAAQASTDNSGKITEEFHHTYALTSDGRVELDNINGSVHISAWDRNEVKVDAVKYARTKERLDEAKIVVEANANSVSIRTEYPERGNGWRHDDWNNPASVEYTLTVPRKSRIDGIKLINGSLDVEGLTGEVHASCINGRLTAKGLAGRTELSTINSRLQAEFDQVPGRDISLSSVNGTVELVLPSDTKADIEATTVHGGIDNDFGLHVNNHRFVGHDLRGEIGGGGTPIRLSNVNGRISVRHANDGKAMSPAKNRDGRDDDTI